MKKMTFLACAAMLTSAIALNSCKSDDPIGGFEGDAEVVKTEFAVSLPNNVAGNGAKHMPSATVQKDGITQFQGMNSIILIPFAKEGKIVSGDVRLGKNIHLDEIKVPGSATDTLGRTSRAKVYSDVAIPLSTASFLFYGKSAASSDAANAKFIVGSLKADTSSEKNPAAIKFELDSIITASQYTNAMAADGNGGKLMTYLTTITAAIDGGGKMWREYTSSMTGDSVIYYSLYKNYIKLEDLSSFQVERMLTDLYRSLKPLRAQTLADNIMKAIESSTYTTTTPGVAFANDSVKLIDALRNFPQELKIPEGAVSTKWSTDKFVAGDYSASRTYPTKFVYPVGLWYYGNSAILTSNKSQKNLYDDTKGWDLIKAAYGDAPVVNTLTRSVLMSDSVQYGVARFDVQVKLNGTELADNSEHAEGAATPVNVSAGFKVTAVFVGGQQQVDFKFEPNTTATVYTVYDNVMASGNMIAMPSSYSDFNHTLVFETAQNQDIRIAVEMLNTGEDFYGYGDQLIPKNSKFYVCANLDNSLADETDNKVFKQDFTTTANLNLKDLKKSYNTIPDLRTPELEIGFAVDLNWQNGNEYTIDFE